MLRLFLSSTVVLAIVLGGMSAAMAEDKAKSDTKGAKTAKGAKATITKVDAKKGTLTVKMKDKDGKDVEKTFKLTEEVRMLDSTGRVAALDVFQAGNQVLVIEAEGRLRELRQPATKQKTGGTPAKEKAQK